MRRRIGDKFGALNVGRYLDSLHLRARRDALSHLPPVTRNHSIENTYKGHILFRALPTIYSHSTTSTNPSKRVALHHQRENSSSPFIIIYQKPIGILQNFLVNISYDSLLSRKPILIIAGRSQMSNSTTEVRSRVTMADTADNQATGNTETESNQRMPREESALPPADHPIWGEAQLMDGISLKGKSYVFNERARALRRPANVYGHNGIQVSPK